MGQTLSEPVVVKHTSMIQRGKKFAVAVSDMQGWRISMEDSHSLHLSLPPSSQSESTLKDKLQASKFPAQPIGCSMTNYDDDSSQDSSQDSGAGAGEDGEVRAGAGTKDGPAFFGVYDGHGGSAVARYTGTTIHSRLAALDSYAAGDYEKALKTLYLKTDEDLRADPNFFNEPSGCTAVSGIITLDGRIIVANAGDSRSVLGYKGEAKPMSTDHKPTDTAENARIVAGGGFVEFGRVNGNLALSRALGDFEFKQNYSLDAEHQVVTADPEIVTLHIDGEEEFLVLACDGIWDCLSSQQVVDFVRRAIANGDPLTKICEDAMVKCLAPDTELGGIGCDNMTIAIVALLGGRTLEEWQAWVKDRVEKKIGYDTPLRVADVFGNSTNVSPLGSAVRQASAGGFANLQQVLSASGIKFKTADADEDADEDMSESEDEESVGENAPTTQGGESAVSRQQALADFVRAITGGSLGTSASADEDSHMEDNDSKASASISSVEPSEESTSVHVPGQLEKTPGGDAPSGAVKVEGLMDKAETPFSS